MGSAESNSPDELTVLVTGFGPFKEDFPRNPAWEITRQLPDHLPAAPPKTALQSRSGAALPPVRIRTYPEPVRVNYQIVRALVPTLWDDDKDKDKDGQEEEEAAPPPPPQQQQQQQGRKIDFMLHIGMAGPRPFHSIERRGHRDGYRGRDVDNELLGDEDRHRRQGEGWVWHGLPHDIETDLDLGDVLERWRGYCPWDSDLRVSEDAGRYLCDFIYYSSLAHLYRKGQHRRVLFLHVPADASDEAVRKGVNLTVQLIRAVLESEQARKANEDKKKNGGQGDGKGGGEL